MEQIIMIKIGIDQSMRSSAISVLNNDELIELFIYQPVEKNYYKLLNDSYNFYFNLFTKLKNKYIIEIVNIEDLSLNSKSAVKDVIFTNHWLLRLVLWNLNINHKVISPAQWRKINEIIPKDKKQKEWKIEIGKNYLKELALRKADKKTIDKIMKFCKDNKLKKKSEHDLIESYWIGRC